MLKRIIDQALIFSIILAAHHIGNAQIEKSARDLPGVGLERTEIRTIHSDIVGQDYEILISLPKSYSLHDTSYPVIYLLDSYHSFSMVKGMTDVFARDLIMPEVIIVSIGYGIYGPEAQSNWIVGRTRDFTPVSSNFAEEWVEKSMEKIGLPEVEIHTGGAPLFLNFIRTELIPFVETNYRIDENRRTFSGYSFGGLFGLYVLFHDPTLFNKYFIGSPAIMHDKGITYEYEISYADTNPDLKAAIFMNSGEKEEVFAENVKKMTEILRSRNYKNLKLNTVIFEGEGHITCFPAAISRGLTELFALE
jgi:predicted alpha/beta superfamily hydrolase